MYVDIAHEFNSIQFFISPKAGDLFNMKTHKVQNITQNIYTR